MLGLIFGRLLGEAPITAGVFAGISTLAIVAAMNDTNGGLYMALMGQYGQPRDVGAYSVMSLESGPFLTMVTLGVAGLSAFPWPTLVGGILPLLAGMLIGNLDREMREFLSRAIPVLIPFFAFALGANLDLGKVWLAGLLGLGLGVAVVVVTGIPLFFADRLTGGSGVAGVAAASTAGNAVAVPAIIASANPAYQDAAAQATILVAASVVVTAILVPLVTAWTARRVGERACTVDGADRGSSSPTISPARPTARSPSRAGACPRRVVWGDARPAGSSGCDGARIRRRDPRARCGRTPPAVTAKCCSASCVRGRGCSRRSIRRCAGIRPRKSRRCSM